MRQAETTNPSESTEFEREMLASPAEFSADLQAGIDVAKKYGCRRVEAESPRSHSDADPVDPPPTQHG